MNRVSQTKTDNSRFETTDWELQPVHATPVSVAPPSTEQRLSLELDTDIPSSFELRWRSRTVAIDQQLHADLLEEGMREYSDIWRRLAEK